MWPSLVAQLVKNLPAMQETQFDSWVGKIPWRRDRLPIPVSKGLPDGPKDKKSNCNAGDLSSIPGSGRSPGERNGYPLENSMDRGAWWAIVHEIAKSWTRLSD